MGRGGGKDLNLLSYTNRASFGTYGMACREGEPLKKQSNVTPPGFCLVFESVLHSCLLGVPRNTTLVCTTGRETIPPMVLLPLLLNQ